ncbi:MAG: F0F1 ATP synthase subunit B [Clostridia bacterium]|nr:F0F1 ATP synthase subunit B [Clostridia bacterium]MDD4146315.1 F0F1 ATP synthase subunit B [Clostridia bacterium]MDD4665822.1 F0F1 ATP synthase subunit B [Clostridia bacterium]
MSFSVSDMIWAIINFLILVVILNKFLFKPLLKTMDARKDEIKQDLDAAAQANAEAQKTKEEYLKQMEEAKADAQQIIVQATKIGEETREKLVNQAQEEASRMAEKAREMIRLEKDEALRQLRDEVASLVVMAAGKVIEQTIDLEAHEQLIREFIAEAGDAS